MNIYILTEEKPKISTIISLLEIYKNDFSKDYTIINSPNIKPIFNNYRFRFSYELNGITIEGIDKIIIKTVSGGSSFLDFLFFVQNDEPVEGEKNNLIFAVEETKTSDDESRNTGVYQRCSKFVYINAFYNVPLYMLYNDELELREEKKPSNTSIFGTNMLLTNGIKIIGKPVDKWFKPFESLDELIDFKNSMRRPPKGNTPILIIKNEDSIEITGCLDKPGNKGRISHDPNIGALSYIACTLRKLGWNKNIVVSNHNIVQSSVKDNSNNKFLSICNLLNMSMKDIKMPSTYSLPSSYWHYEKKSEKMASILFHLICENLGFHEIYQNHAGCERGYFKTINNELLALPKYCGEDNRNLLIPDVIMRDDYNKIIYLIEGKKLDTLANGLKEINLYNDIENLYIKKYFPNYEIKKYLTIFGGKLNVLPNSNVLLYLNDDGEVYINNTEANFKLSFENLFINHKS